MGAKIRVAIYCRVSKKGGRSVERQEQEGRRIAQQKGWDVVAVYRERGSASPFARKAREEWDKLLAAVERGKFDAVIFWMEDRAARDVIAAGEFVQTCRKAGLANIVLPSYNYDLTDQEDVSRFYGEVLHGQHEAAVRSKRVRSAKLEEAGWGWPNPGGRRAFGEPGGRRVRDPAKDDDELDKWLRDERGRWLRVGGIADEQVEEERALIREAARRILAGDSLSGIVVDWNGRGLHGTAGERWSTRPLRRMLLSPRLAGLRDHHGELHPSNGEIEPVLDRATWEAIKAVLTDPARMKTAVGGKRKHLLAGLAVCGVCGAKLHAQRDPDGEFSYRCPTPADGGRRCVRRKAAPVEALILRAVFGAVEKGQEWDELAAKRPTDDPSRPHYEALAQITSELDVLDRRIGEAELAEELGGHPHPSAATLRRMLAERETAREHHQAAVTRLQAGRVVAAVPRNLRQLWPSYSVDRQRAILAAMIERIEIDRQRPLGPGGFDPEAIRVIRRG